MRKASRPLIRQFRDFRVRDPRLNLGIVFGALLIVSCVLMIWIVLTPGFFSTAQIRILMLEGENDTSAGFEGEWDVIGWVYYPSFRDVPDSVAKQHLIGSSHPAKHGIWVLNNAQPSASGVYLYNRISLKNFQYRDAKPIMVGIRFYMEGSGSLLFRYTHSGSGTRESVSIVQDSADVDPEKPKGFCNKIVPPEGERLVESIEIIGFMQDSNSIIIIDQVMVTVGDNDSSLSLMYSLMPDQWCEAVDGNNIATPGKRARKRKPIVNSIKSDRYSVQNLQSNRMKVMPAAMAEVPDPLYLY